MSRKRKPDQEVVGFVGIGFDNQDGHERVTQGDHFIIIGGSHESHEHMQETAIRLAEALQRQGQTPFPDKSQQ